MTLKDWLKEAAQVKQQVSELAVATRPLRQAANEAKAELDALYATLLAANDTIKAYRYDERAEIGDDEFRAALDIVAETQIKIDRQRAIYERRKSEADRQGMHNAYESQGLKRAFRSRFDDYQREQLRLLLDTMDGRREL